MWRAGHPMSAGFADIKGHCGPPQLVKHIIQHLSSKPPPPPTMSHCTTNNHQHHPSQCAVPLGSEKAAYNPALGCSTSKMLHNNDLQECRAKIPPKCPEKAAQCGHQEPPEVDRLQRLAKRIPCLGILLSLIASVLIGTAGLLVKVTHSVHGVQVSVFRAMIQAAIYALILYLRGVKPRPARGEFWPVLGRAFLCSCSITGAYFAIKLIPLGDSTIIKLSLPVWVLLISYFVLAEPCSLVKISAVTVSLTGVALVAKPDDCLRLLNMVEEAFNISSPASNLAANSHQPHYKPLLHTTNESSTALSDADSMLVDTAGETDQLLAGLTEEYSNLVLGRLLALGSSICLALSIISLRMCKVTPVEVIIFWLSVIAVVFGSGLLLAMGEWRLPDNWNDLGLILLNGLFGALGQWFLSSSLKVEQSGVISLVRTFDIIVAFFYSATLLHEDIPSTSIIGAVLVSYGTFAVAVPKLLEARRASKCDS